MRIVIDMQGAQTESRFRGIGRYTMDFSKAVVKNRGDHEVYLALSSFNPETVQQIREEFSELLPQNNIKVWSAPANICENDIDNIDRMNAAELIREAFLASLDSDVTHITSIFEGFGDDAAASIGRLGKYGLTSVTIHDLIPLALSDQYLNNNSIFSKSYFRKIDFLKKADLFLAISSSSKKEAEQFLDVSPDIVFNTLEGVGSGFHQTSLTADEIKFFNSRLGLNRHFVLYTGGADERKNLPSLLKSWATLPEELRASHQLVLAGKMPDPVVRELTGQGHDLGLAHDEVVFTGYVSELDLIKLYNLCKLFIFPSLHEGFGLPVVEAMACGAPVIGSSTTNLPEVIGLDEALFDPYDVQSIAERLRQALTDTSYLNRLREHAKVQVLKFDWNLTAKKAIQAWEEAVVSLKRPPVERDSISRWQALIPELVQIVKEPRARQDMRALATLSHTVAQSSLNGIERQLFVDISELRRNDAATGVQRVVRAYLSQLLSNPPSGFRIEPVYATLEHGYRYARNYVSQFLRQPLLNLSEEPIQYKRGDLFFALDMQHHVQTAHSSAFSAMRQAGVTVKFLVYDLLAIQLPQCFADPHASELHEQLLRLIAQQDEAICISKATADAMQAWIATKNVVTSPQFQTSWVHIGADLEGSQPSNGLPNDAEKVYSALFLRPTFLVVSTIEPRKAQDQVLAATEVLWKQGIDCNLVFVGKQGWKVDKLVTLLEQHPENGRKLFWLQGISDEYLEQIYHRSSCLVISSLNEGFGLPLIEAARAGMPIIARDIPVFREIAGDHATYFSESTDQGLAHVMGQWLIQYENGSCISSRGVEWLTWEQSAAQLKNALVLKNYRRRQLMVDVSELIRVDARSGIQRVVRNILREWLDHPPEGYRIEPVYATTADEYRYARNFTAQFLNLSGQEGQDQPIEYATGDVFFGLDFQPQIVSAHAQSFQCMRVQGVKVQFLLHDILCIQMPQYFLPGSAPGFEAWLNVVTDSDGVICVSETVSNEVREWVSQNKSPRMRPLNVDWSHNGADIIEAVQADEELAEPEIATLQTLKEHDSLLMVGTLEPRKGHAQVLNAMEHLWNQGQKVNLVIVGKQGWMVEDLVHRMQSHPLLGKRLFWLQSVSDQYLQQLYKVSIGLIAASHGEGFGLPLIEAAQYRIPVIARDIPVFREVAGKFAEYFDATSNDFEFSVFLSDWLKRRKKDQHASVEGMRWLSWSESAKNLLSKII